MRVQNDYARLKDFLRFLGKNAGRGRLQAQASPKEHLPCSMDRRHTLINERGIAMTFQERGTSWFLAQLKPNCGHIAERNLKLQGFRTFLPTEDGTKRVRGKFVTAPRPLFPGYIFVQIDTGAGTWRTINSTNGITRLVSFGQEPAPVPLDIVSQLMLRCDATGKLLPPERLTPGDQVCLTSGPFADFVGRIEAIAPERRVWVLMEIMGGQTRVAVAADQLRMA
jgi:transcriptional antiterminator RfaH